LTPRVSLFAIALVFGFAACVIVSVLVLRPVERIARTARVSSRACRAARSGDLTVGHYDFVVSSANKQQAGEPTEASWTRSDAAA
jgi:hypothetical protein